MYKAPYNFESIGPLEFEEPFARDKTKPLPVEEIILKGNHAINTKLFELEGTNGLSDLVGLMHIILLQRFQELHQVGQIFPSSFSLEVDLGIDKWNLWLCDRNERYRVLRLPLKVDVENRVFEIPLTLYAYHQETIEGVLAWVVSAKGIVEGKEISCRWVFKSNKDGFLELSSLQQEGSDNLELLFSTDQAALAAFVAQQFPENRTSQPL